ncbi:MAG: hypothetical protein JNK57_18330 [Planctomycetaceae bacterium]|nr:hypothetical protein [Planctomycetaceae bacterium]
MSSTLNRRDLMSAFTTFGAVLGLNHFATGMGLAGSRPQWRGAVIDTTYSYELDLQSEGIVLLGPDEDTKKVAFTIGSQQSFSERSVIINGDRMASRVYQKAEMVKRFGALEPETVSIQPAPLEVLAMPESPESGRMIFHCADRQISGQVTNLLQVPLSPIWLDEMAAVLFKDKAKLVVGDRVALSADLVTKLFCLEEVRETSIVCEVEKANETQAVLKLSGDASGRSLDVATKIRVNASVRAIFETRTLSQLRASFFEQREKGAISPAYAATTKIKLDQTLAATEISAATIRQQTDRSGSAPILVYTSLQNHVEFQHTPQWHLVLDQKGAAIWRLIADGEPMTQCNMLFSSEQSKTPLDLKTFVSEVESSLAGNLTQILKQETLKGANQAQVFRIEAIGKEDEIELVWVYYLIQDANGRTAQLVFTTEADLKDAVGQTDVLIAQSFRQPAAPVAEATNATVR